MPATVPKLAPATAPRQRPTTVLRPAEVQRLARVPMPAMMPMLVLAPMPATVLRSAMVRPSYCKASEGTEVRSSVGRARGEEEAMASFVFF